MFGPSITVASATGLLARVRSEKSWYSDMINYQVSG
jgi:hypothetical protein